MSSPRPDSPTITLYTRRDCHLCDEAARLLAKLSASMGFTVEPVDIDADPVLRERHGDAVPVIAVAGRVIASAPIDEALLRRALRELGDL